MALYKNYKNYYIVDGFGNYTPVPGERKEKPKVLTTKPSTWATDWKSYYIKRKINGSVQYVKLEDDVTLGRRSTAPKWQKNSFYAMESYYVTPAWQNNVDYYSKAMVVPKYADVQAAGGVFRRSDSVTQIIPWAENTYYTKRENVNVGIPFVAGSYFRQVLDHYAALVEGGVERLKDLNVMDELSVTLKEQEKQYDIGDIIGGTEELSGINIQQPITKKIVKIEGEIVNIEHQVLGGIAW